MYIPAIPPQPPQVHPMAAGRIEAAPPPAVGAAAVQPRPAATEARLDASGRLPFLVRPAGVLPILG